MKTTLDLPNDLLREARRRAVNQGKTLRDVIADLLRQGLEQPSPTVSRCTARRGTIELPLFPSSPNAPAQRMSVDELVVAEQQTLTRDDLERFRPST